MRVWHLSIPPGGRCGFHRHVNPYFWTCLTDGHGRNYMSSGKIDEARYHAGMTRHFHYGEGEQMVHSIENLAGTDLVFTTVEFIDGENAPLPIPDEMRLREPA